ncbi:hypothetical protein KKC67_03590, partial [Patescibacteria group bacterium]|nr:hypothetical protein [Patescibacteria group bacterium]
VCIAYHNYADKLCIQHNLDFEKVMTRFNETYNEGYTKLGKKNVVRPVLTPSNGAIGGHCIVNNKNILKEQFGDDPLLQNIV